MAAPRQPNTGRVALWACPREHPGTVFGPAAMRPQPGGGAGEISDGSDQPRSFPKRVEVPAGPCSSRGRGPGDAEVRLQEAAA